jgi:lipopolysaccharide transport system ATP-binding protein
MNDIAIQVEQLSKKFYIGRREKYRTLRDTLADMFTAPLRKAGNLLKGHATGAAQLSEEIWALKDVSFNVRRGEVVGIIGRNGAGKSTILKILSRITEPTKGHAEIRGRIGSLLEVGTGFHQELTGRENIFLNGSILGMKRDEINKNFDEIVAFAEVEKFIDTPVKHYSSGMYLRLAFAVAAHLEPEILIVDEVLAVGDMRFQKKCIDKMKDVGQNGRTVLFVSHNMPAVTRLCERVILLDEGRMIEDGPAQRVVSDYLKSDLKISAVREWPEVEKAPAGSATRLHAVRVRNENGQIADVIDIRQQFCVEMEYEVLKAGYVLLPHFGFCNEQGDIVFITIDQDPDWRQRQRPEGRYVSSVLIPGNLLAEGMLFVNCYLMSLNPDAGQFSVHYAVAFNIVDSLDGNSSRGDYSKNVPGVVRPLLHWDTEFRSAGIVA